MAANGYLDPATLTQVDGWAYLETNTAHAWVAACNEMAALGHGQMTISAPDGAYRDYARQVYWKAYWTGQGMPNNAATPGTSNHGLGTCVDIWEVVKWPYSILAPVMNRHGFVHDFAPEPWHWHHTSINPADNTATAAVTSTPITPVTSTEKGSTVTLYYSTVPTPVPADYTARGLVAATIYALAGESPGTPANWLETQDTNLANGLAGFHSISQHAVHLEWPSYLDWKAKYLTPVLTKLAP